MLSCLVSPSPGKCSLGGMTAFQTTPQIHPSVEARESTWQRYCRRPTPAPAAVPLHAHLGVRVIQRKNIMCTSETTDEEMKVEDEAGTPCNQKIVFWIQCIVFVDMFGVALVVPLLTTYFRCN